MDVGTRGGAPPFRPIAEGERILPLDVLRGFALFGILVVNAYSFALPSLELPGPGPNAPVSHPIVRGVVGALFQQKFVSLFSLLFGIGLVLQHDRAAATGRPFVPLYLRRLAILFVFGLAHGFGLWYGDILALYALAGTILLAFAAARPRTLFVLAAVAMFGATLAITGASALEVVFRDIAASRDVTGPTARQLDALREAERAAGPWLDGEIAAYKYGPFSEAMSYRAGSYALMFASCLFTYLWHVVAMFLLGAGLMRAGLFDPANARWHRRFVLIGFGIGLPLEVVRELIELDAGYEDTLATALTVPLHQVGSVLLMLGYVGVITRAVQRGVASRLQAALACVGRMALTNYLLQTVLGTFVTYWWGLALFNELSPPQLFGLACAIFAFEVMLSLLWLRAFTMGPMEWLWRRLTYPGVPLPLRRRAAAN